MKRLFFLFLAGFIGAALSTATQAVELYTGSVTVANQGAGERARALPLALRQVLVKVSGDARVADNPGVTDALGQAGAIMLQTTYREDVLTGATGVQSKATTLLAEFDRAGVDAILRKAGRPIWTSDRPAVLAWLVIESGAARQVASAGQSAALGALLRQAEHRGFDVVLPAWDYQDQGRAPIESLWLGQLSALRAASARYGTRTAVLARLRRTADGWNSRYSLVDLSRQGKAEEWLAIHPSSSAALADAIDGSADRLAARFATSSDDLLNASYDARVAGVRSGADYGRILSYLNGLHVVQAAEAAGAEGDRLLLKLDLRVTPQRFATMLEGDGILDVVQLPPSLETGADPFGPDPDAVISASDGESSPAAEPVPLAAESLPVLELSLRR